MSAFQSSYPEELRPVIGHAKRLMKILAKMEQGRADPWFVGRAAELRGVVSLALADWRAETRDTEAAGRSILSYLDAIHRGASKKLGGGPALACCEPDEAITGVVGDPGSSTSGALAAPTEVTGVTHGPTVPAGRVDSPDVLARVQGGLPLVDVQARRMARLVGQRCATMDDLRAFGREGLLDAARAFDDRRGVPFDRWASLRIRNTMIDGVRRWGAVPPRVRRRLQALEAEASEPCGAKAAGPSKARAAAKPVDLSVMRVARPTDAPIGLGEGSGRLGVTPEDLLERAQLASAVRTLVAALPDRERGLIEQIYFHGLTQEQAAAAMGVSLSWAHRVHARAIDAMERALRQRSRPVGSGGKGADGTASRPPAAGRRTP